ncbi:MAG: DUF3137 domain-containing protein [Bacteroidaceae bacterium]|nr:DUF3137 domain-containing protein [Bacteroidaceae bacterium]
MKIEPEKLEQLKACVSQTLQELAIQKKKDRIKAIFLSLFVPMICFGAIVIGMGTDDERLKVAFSIAGVSCLLTAIISFGHFGSRRNKTYKTKVMPLVVETALPGAVYSPKGLISKKEINDSKIFDIGRKKDYKTEDSVCGKVGQTNFIFSEVEVTHTVERNEDSTETVTDFQGFAFKADFHKNFNGHTLVSNRRNDLSNKVGFFSRSLKKCVMEDVNFEQTFKTYTNDDQEARYILTPSLQLRILDLQETLKGRVSLAFYHNEMLLMVDDRVDHFEVKYNFDNVLYDINALTKLIDIVEIMNLNLRIWSKE